MIKHRDKVLIYMSRKVFDFQEAPYFEAEILNFPIAPGDCYILRVEDDRDGTHFELRLNPNAADFIGIEEMK